VAVAIDVRKVTNVLAGGNGDDNGNDHET
jgi:hypothetical protein